MVRTDSRRYRQVTHTPTHTHTDNGSFLVETYSTRQQKPSGTKKGGQMPPPRYFCRDVKLIEVMAETYNVMFQTEKFSDRGV